jgi:hypothetical protein
LQGVKFVSDATTTMLTESIALNGRSFTAAGCNEGNPEQDKLTFNADGSITDLGSHGDDTVETVTVSATDKAKLFSADGLPNASGQSTLYRAVKSVVDGIEQFFIAEFSQAGAVLNWWRELTGTTADHDATAKAWVDRANALLDGKPTAAQVRTLLADDYLAPEGISADDVASEVASDAAAGLAVGNIRLLRVVAFDVSKPNNIDEAKTAAGEINENNLGVVLSSPGDDESGQDAEQLIKGSDGQWRNAGSQRRVYTNVQALVYQHNGAGTTGGSTGTGITVNMSTGHADITKLVVSSSAMNGPITFVRNESGSLVRQAAESDGGDYGNFKGYGKLVNPSQMDRRTLFTYEVYIGEQKIATYQELFGSDLVPASAAGMSLPRLTSVVPEDACDSGSVTVSWSALPSTYKATDVGTECRGNGSSAPRFYDIDVSNASATVPLSPVASTSQVWIELGGVDTSNGVRYAVDFVRSQNGPSITSGSAIEPDFSISPTQESAGDGETLVSISNQSVISSVVCDATTGSISAINFPQDAVVSATQSRAGLAGRSFKAYYCDEPGNADTIKFNSDGSLLASFNDASMTYSADEVNATFSDVGMDDGDDTVFLRLYTIIKDGVQHYLIAEKDVGKADDSVWMNIWYEIIGEKASSETTGAEPSKG